MCIGTGAPPTVTRMTDPGSFNLGQAGLATQGIGALVGLMGAYASVGAQQRQLRFQAQLAQLNAQTSERNAESVLNAGQRSEQRSMIATANLKSTQQASLAANGIDLGEGSAANVLTSTDVLGKIDANTIAANAVREAWGYRTQGTSYQIDAIQRNSAADGLSAAQGGFSSLLGGAGQVAQGWYQLNRTGALPGGSAFPQWGAGGGFGSGNSGMGG